MRRCPPDLPITALALCLLFSACGDHRPSSRQRFIDTEPGELPSFESLYPLSRVESWDFTSGQALWKLEPPAYHVSLEGGWKIFLTGERAALHAPVEIDASQIHVLHVVLDSHSPVTIRVAWRGPGQRFKRQRQVSRRWEAATGRRERRYLFDFRPHPEWVGPIEEMRITLRGAWSHRPIVKRIEALAYQKPPEDLSVLLARAWAVDLDHDIRSALLTPPGHAAERRLKLPPESRLRFAYGATGTLRHTLSMTVTVVPESAPEATLLDARLEPGDAARWRSGELDLSPYGGQTVTLGLAAESSEPLDLYRAMPVWATPELFVPDPPPAPRYNLVLISIDTLRADRLSAYGYPRPTSPNIEAWAREHAVLFTQAVAQAPWTLPSHTSLLTGIEAMRHGANHWDASAPFELKTLAEHLHEAGYATAAVTGGGWLHPKFGLGQGFERFDYWPVPGQAEDELSRGVEKVKTWLGELPEPFLLFFHTFEVHDYRLRSRDTLASIPNLTDDQKNAEHSSAYNDAIERVDLAIGEILAEIDRLGLRGRTLIVLTSDHGESLGENGVRGHGHLNDQNLLVPLILELPGDTEQAGAIVEQQVRSVDLLPTLLETLGLSPPENIDGISLHPVIAGSLEPPAIALSYASGSEGLSIREGGSLKYIFDASAWQGEDKELLFRLRRDPGEAQNVAPKLRAAKRFRAQAARLIRENLAGAHWRLRNGGEGRLVARIRGTIVRDDSLISPNLPGPVIRRKADDWAEVRLRPGQSKDIIFERVPDAPFEIEVAWVPKAGERLEWQGNFQPDALPLSLELDGTDWRRSDDSEPPETGFSLGWNQSSQPDGISPHDEDPELRERLKALGYLG